MTRLALRLLVAATITLAVHTAMQAITRHAITQCQWATPDEDAHV